MDPRNAPYDWILYLSNTFVESLSDKSFLYSRGAKGSFIPVCAVWYLVIGHSNCSLQYQVCLAEMQKGGHTSCAARRLQLKWPDSVPFIHPKDFTIKELQSFIDTYEVSWRKLLSHPPHTSGQSPASSAALPRVPKRGVYLVSWIFMLLSNGLASLFAHIPTCHFGPPWPVLNLFFCLGVHSKVDVTIWIAQKIVNLPSWSSDRSALNGLMIASADDALQVNLKQKLSSSFLSTLACQSPA